jgi:hypothetical protein
MDGRRRKHFYPIDVTKTSTLELNPSPQRPRFIVDPDPTLGAFVLLLVPPAGHAGERLTAHPGDITLSS